MRELKYGFTDISVPLESKGEASLLWAFNADCERIVKYWLTDEEWARRFESQKDSYWMFQDVAGLARALFFMDKLDDVGQSRADFIYGFCKAEVERRKHESNT